MDKLYLLERNISTNIHWIIEVDPESRKDLYGDCSDEYEGVVVTSPSKHRSKGHFSDRWNVSSFEDGINTPKELIDKIYGP